MRRMLWIVVIAASSCGGDGSGNSPADALAGADAADLVVGTDAPSGPPLLYDRPISGDFGNVTVGIRSEPLQFTILNMGGATSLTVGAGAPFAVDSTTCGSSLGAGASCTIDVVVTLSMPGTMGGEVHAIGDGTALTRAPLAAFGVPDDGRLRLTPGAHGFGDETVGQTSAVKMFTVTNPGGATVGPLSVSAGGSNPTDFVLAGGTCAGAKLPPAGTCTFTVAFAPATTRQKAATITVTGAAMATASVTGSGI